jgi:hypothetical protein
MECTACDKLIQTGDIIMELSKGSWDGEEFIHEEVKGTYHESCFPNNVPMEENGDTDG